MKNWIRLGKSHDNLVAFLFLFPFLIVFLTFLVWPIFYSLYLSFLDQASGYTLEGAEFIGFDNFIRMFHDREFWWALIVTLYYSILIIPGGIMASLVLAVLLNNRIRGVKFYRAAFFLPNVLDMLVIGIIWTLIYSKDGVFQWLIEKIHMLVTIPISPAIFETPGPAILGLFFRTSTVLAVVAIIYMLAREYHGDYQRNGNSFAAELTVSLGVIAAVAAVFVHGGVNGWIAAILGPAVKTGVLGNAVTVMPAVIFALIIKGAGFGMILFLAAIQGIPSSVYEAADIDGANALQKFKYITMPLVKPVMLFMVITGVTGALNAFTEIFAMTKGGPIINLGGHSLGASKLTGYYLFTKWEQSEYGYAAAISYGLLVLTLIITVINIKFMNAEEE
jgi:ABC-type sugar transport system permease subunit